MNDPAANPDQLRAEIARLRDELASAERHLQQVRRVAETSEAIANRSKRAMLRTHSELQKLVGELRQAKAEAEQAAAAKGRFLAVMSHELRTPLNGMVGSAELLLDANLPPAAVELARLLQRCGNSLLTIVNDILDYSRIEAGQMPLEQIPFRLADCVREVADLQLGVAAGKGIELRVCIDARCPPVVTGDPGRLRQVLLNLVHNALKFTTHGHVEIRVETAEVADVLRFLVSDTGVGIAPQTIGRLFDAFVQEDASTTRRFGGTGLGLAISKRLVQRMGGDIVVESAAGRGATFAFTCVLPANTEFEPAPREEIAPAVIADIGAPHVLVVDDHDANRLLVRRMLDRLGCRIAEASDGVQAVQSIASGSFDLVLMDCSMPLMDGYEATRAVRKFAGERARTKIVALTANAMPEDRERCLAAGMDGYLPKPVRMRELEAEVRRLLGR